MTAAQSGTLAETVVAFVRTLRHAGLPLGPERTLRALEAAQAVGLERRDDFYWALHATLTDRVDQHPVFDQCFKVFWRNPELLKKAMALMLPALRADLTPQGDPLSRRLQDALRPQSPPPDTADTAERQDIEIDARLVWSDQEILRHKDFEQMSAAELAEARRIIDALPLARMTVPTRRLRPAPSGPKIDLRQSLRRSLRGGGDSLPLVRAQPRQKPPPIVALCDISGSMGQYTRLFLRFLYALTNDRARSAGRVHVFLFGTRLSNVSRTLRRRDSDEALNRLSRDVPDWDGGTRMGSCLRQFNRQWGRRVLGQGAIVLLMTDGLDRDAGAGLEPELDRLRRSCRRLIWLNPLLRWDGYQPRAKGAAALITQVDEFRPVHSLNSLDALAQALRGRSPLRKPSP
ncbi:vWA domain-containing protein [Novispirillum itersonii]|uniref:vWA domain-containing protein n=1 Tax=Novispirillum itersonii TaxID=189 RepID=UPI0003790D80|nr:VWA domain-containing protein [Novispirillum itersonii]